MSAITFHCTLTVYLITFCSGTNLNELQYEIISDYSVNDCLRFNNDNKSKYFDIDDNGFPLCENYDTTKTCDPKSIVNSCNPGLKCSDSSTCSEVDETSCFKYYANVENNENIMQLLWTPDCMEDGSWATKQCKGGPSGRCFCYDEKGNRLFGSAFYKDSTNMTCACSKRTSDLLENPDRYFVSFHCDSKGNYEALQCESGFCWCSDDKTGEVKSMIVPEKSMQYLSCGSNLQYYKKCESHALAQAQIIKIMKRHGTTSPNIQMVACENDGTYGPYAIQKTNVYCVDEFNKKLGSYQTTIDKISSMDCNCGQDEALYSKVGKQFSLDCDPNGSYKPLQSILENDQVRRFCVDKDGNIKVDNVDENAGESYCNKFYD